MLLSLFDNSLLVNFLVVALSVGINHLSASNRTCSVSPSTGVQMHADIHLTD
jgi:hypothetical protein